MRHRIYLSIASICLLTLGACSADGDGRVATGTIDSTTINQIAGDKNDVAAVIRSAHEHGTLDDALALVMADSAMAADISRVVRDDARFVASDVQPIAPTASAPATQRSSSPARAKSTGTSTTTTTKKGDVLDQTEATAKNVNERLEQAARVKREAAEAKRRVEDILGKKP